MLGDKPIGDEFLSEGIYVELRKKDTILNLKNEYDIYLINRDGQGNAEIIHAQSGFAGIDLNIEVGKSIERSNVSYPKDFDYLDRVVYKLNLDDDKLEEKWNELKIKAHDIDQSKNINSNIASYAFISTLLKDEISIKDLKEELSKELKISDPDIDNFDFLNNLDKDLNSFGVDFLENIEKTLNNTQSFLQDPFNDVKNESLIDLINSETIITSKFDIDEITNSQDFIKEQNNIKETIKEDRKNNENEDNNANNHMK